MRDPERVILCGGYSDSMGGDAQGVGLLREGEDGVTFAGTLAEASSPSFLLQRGDVVYTVDEANAAVMAFRLVGNGLVPLGSRSTSGRLPCHLSADAEWLYVSNYASGSFDVFPILPDGSLAPRHQTLEGRGSGPHPVQDGPHAHSTLVVDDLVYSADLGADRVHLHRWANGRLHRVDSIEFPAGSGPRDLLHLDGRVLVLGELSQRVYELADGSVLRWGSLVADPVPGDHAAALVAVAGGRYLLSCLRGSNRLAVMDATTLTPVSAAESGGDWPRHVAVIGRRIVVANQLSGGIAAFDLDEESGIVRPYGVPQKTPSPTFVLPARWPDFAEPDYLVK